MSLQQPQVFISYQRADESFARQVREHLASHGVSTWMDQYDIPVGAYWPDEIDKGLAASDTIIGILSPDSVESRNVKNEWDWAIQNGRRLVLMQVAPCLIPHRYVSINFIDATGQDASAALAALVRSLGAGEISDTIQIPGQAPPIQVHHASRISRPATRPVPFIAGREREQTILRGHLDRLLDGRGSLVLIGGEAGIGKTTLTNWLAAEAEAHGAIVLAGGCYDLTTTPPYGPWGEIVRSWPEDRGLPPVPDALRGGEAMARLQSQAALFELSADLLASAGMVRPLVVLLEDLHWADQPSLDLLRYLARLVGGFRMMLVATYRDDEITRRHPLFALIPALAREPGAERISLQRLDGEAIRGLIASRYGIDEDERERLVAYIHQATEGNPFFATEVLRALEEAHTLSQDDASWRVGDLERVGVPELVRQVIGGRLTRLGEDAHRLLQIAAVVGHEVPVDLWVEVSGEDEGLLSESLDRATEARIVEELPRGDGFRFTHALIRETLYEGLGLLRRRTLHRRAGEALATGNRPDPDAVAYHFSQAGDERALNWLIQAAERANRSYAWPVAADRYERAATIIVDDLNRRREYGWLLVSAAFMLRYSNPQQAIRYMEEAATIGTEVGDGLMATYPRLQAGYYRVSIGQMRVGVDQMVAIGPELEAIFRDGRIAEWEPPLWTELSSFERISELAAVNPDRQVVLARGLAALHLAGVGRFREARNLAEQLAVVWPPETLTSASAPDQASGLGDLYLALAGTYHAMGQPDRSLESATIALRAYEIIGHYFLINICRDTFTMALIAYRTEQVERRRVETTAARDAIERARGALAPDIPTALSGFPTVIIEGGWSTTFAALHTAVSTIDRAARSPVNQVAASCYATIAMLLGRYAEARHTVDAVLPDGDQTEPGDLRYMPAMDFHRVAIDLALVDGDMRAARGWLESHDRWMAWSGAVLGQVEGHLGWARYYWLAGDRAAAQAQAQAALTKARDPRQPLGLIASHRLLGELATERRDLDTAAGHLHEALTLADACAAPYERALTLVAQAELAIATGAALRDTLSQARAICERLGAQPTLDRIAALEQQRAGRGAQ